MISPLPQIEDSSGDTEPRSRRRVLAIIVGAALTVGALAIGAVVSTPVWMQWVEPAAIEPGRPSGPVTAYVPIPDMVANLSQGAAPRFVKLRVTLKAADAPGAANALRAKTAEFQDIFSSYMNALHPDDLFGAAGFERLRAGLWRRAALVLGDDADILQDVLIVEFVRQ